jgi:hypothetical protein
LHAAIASSIVENVASLYIPFVEAVVPLLLNIEKTDLESQRVNLAAPEKARLGGHLLHSVEEEARGASASQLRHLQIMKHLRLPNWHGAELPVWPPHRPPNAAVIAPVLGGDPRLSSDYWWEPKQEQAQAAAEREAREEKEREARALESYRSPRRWEKEGA